jgi:hypothetical protein
MGRKLILMAVCALTLAFCGSGHAQDSPSLGDLARQAQKNKTNASAKKIFTNDDFASAPATGPSIDSGLAASGSTTPAAPGAPAAAGKSNEPPTALQAIDRMEGVINQMDPLDRAALAKFVLEGVDKNFPGRPAWEEKLFAAKQVYVTQGRDFVRKARAMVASAEPAKDGQGANDSGAKDQSDRMQSVIQYGAHIEAVFQEVITEGRDLASKAPAQ